MEIEITTDIAKNVIYGFNAIFLISAIGVILFEIYSKSELGDIYSQETTLIITLEVLFAMIVFIGCYGTIQEHGCMLTTYAVLLLSLATIQILLAIYYLVVDAHDKNGLRDFVRTYFTELYKLKNDDEIRGLLKYLHSKLECCGINGPNGSEVSDGPGLVIDSCCANSNSPCTVDGAYQTGCLDVYADRIDVMNRTFNIANIIFALIELAGGLFICYVRDIVEEE